MSKENNVRIFLLLFGIYAAIAGPWWLPIVPIVLLSIRYRAWDAMMIGLLVDFLWLPTGMHLPLYLILSILVVWALEPLRKELLLA